MASPVCGQCGLISSRAERKVAGGCPHCISIEEVRRSTVQDLYSSFAGRGKRGFVAWLKFGKLLEPIKDETEMAWHNDRCQVLQAMVSLEKYPMLIVKVADAILELARTELEA